MTRQIERALICAVVAVGSLSISSVRAEETEAVVASLSPHSSISAPDPIMNRALEIMQASQHAQQSVLRQKAEPKVEPIVRSRHDSSHTYILGGSAAIPM